ncbi:MAG: IMP dehydrogenase [Lachnospirales bacterium]
MINIVNEGLTFDDILIVPGESYSDVNKICTKCRFSKNININIPLVSAGRDTVTAGRMAISIARQGGIGIIHKNFSIEEQASEVDRVKRSEHGVITDPFFLSPNNYVYEAEKLMSKYHISGVPITEHGLLVGIVTNRDLRFENDFKKKIYEVMTRDNLVTAPEGITMAEAKEILTEHKVEKLPIVDEDGYLKGLITTKDIQKTIKYPNSAKDENGRLLVAAAVAVNDELQDRVKALYKAKVNAIVLETETSIDDATMAIKWIKEKYPKLDVIAGCIVRKESALKLIKAGADGIRVGFGAGSTSTRRIVTGVGLPQVTALSEVYEVCKEYDIPLLNVGGINYSGDITKALAVGADTVILGGILAGTDDAPGDIELFKGQKYKVYRGITSSKPVEINSKKTIEINEGIDARVAYKGSTEDTLLHVISALKLGLSYIGIEDIAKLRDVATFTKVSNAALKESHPHFVQVTRDNENYSFSNNL